MKNIILSLACFSSLYSATSMQTWLSEGTTNGQVKYYYIQTDKDNGSTKTSAHTNSVGGFLSYQTGNFNGLEAKVTFMTTNGFLLPDRVDTSILGRDNGVRIEGDPSGKVAQESFSVLGEANLKYTYENFDINYGRQVVNTPLIDAKNVRMLPSAVQGSIAHIKLDDFIVSAAWLDKFKQRTSNKFIDMTKHALGDATKAVTGHDEGDVIYGAVNYKNENLEANVYNYYAFDFINSIAANLTGKIKRSDKLSFAYGVEYINQKSIGNADTNLAQSGSATNGQKIDVNAFSLKVSAKYDESTFYAAYSNIARSSSKHDSLVLPWDGTPLFTNMITSNDLFQSNYGKALNADSAYIGGTQGVKLAYTQTFDFTGYKGYKAVLSWAQYINSRADYDKAQQDYNIVLAYAVKPSFSLALKGIHVVNNTSLNASNDTVSQLNTLNQYRVIASYNF
jgi:hypothetical protein